MTLPFASLCLALGLTAPTPPPQPILGGAVVAACGWPTVVSVGGFCSGTLIHPQVVAYAAHCGDEVPWIQFADEIDAAGRREVVPELCVVHPVGSYGFGTDFAFCRLPAPITDIAITPPLMGCEVEEMLTIGQAVTLVGFGQSDDPDINYGIKRFVETQISGFSWDEVFVGDENKGACYGDSGGPALVQLADGSWRSFAVTSWGKAGCGAGNYFSLLHRGVDWIETESGIDITPCHDSLGGWDPSPTCGGFAVGDPGIASGSWDSCAGAPSSGPSASCGAAFDDAPDTTPPTVKILEPGDGRRYNGKDGGVLLEVAVEALDVGWGTERVVLRVIDGDKTLFENTDSGAPFVFPKLGFATGLWTLEAEAVDRAGNITVSERVTFGVNLDAPAPPDEASTGESATGDTPTTGESDTSGAPGTGDESSTGGTGAALDDEGCGCRSESGSRGASALAAGALLLGLRRRRRASVALALACGLTGCNNDDTQGAASSTGEDGSTTSTSGTASTGEAPTTASSAESSSTGEPQPICGNGEIDGEELCDDGNLISGDGCNPDCLPSGTEVWRRSYPDDDPSIDHIHALAIDPEGNLVAAGVLGSGKDQSRAWVAKLSPGGELLWEHVWSSDGGNLNYYLDVAVNADGKIVAGGCANCRDFGNILLTSLDKDGKAEVREIAEEMMEHQRITDVTITDAGNVVAIVEVTNKRVSKVQAFDAAGATLWTHEGGAKTWQGGGLVRRSGETATVVALREVSDPVTHEVRVFSIDDDTGKVQWTKLHGDPLTRYYVQRIAAGPEGQLVVCGSLTRTEAEDTLLIGLNAVGGELWKTRVPVPGPGFDGCAGVVVTQDGGAAFAGTGLAGPGVIEMWVGKVDASGTPVWANTYGSMGTRDDVASDLVELASGDLVVGGSLYDEASKSRTRALLRLTP